MAKMELAITAETSHVRAVARIVAKHLGALADELEMLDAGKPPQPDATPAGPKAAEPEPAPARTEINNTSASTERRWSPHVSAPAMPFGFTGLGGKS